MNIETKSVYGDVDEYLDFGWKHTEDTSVRSGRTSHIKHILARDKDMPNYRLITALEAKYFDLKKQKWTYYPMEPGITLLLFLLLIFPGIIYFGVKSNQKSKVEAHNAKLQKQMNEVLEEVAPLL